MILPSETKKLNYFLSVRPSSSSDSSSAEERLTPSASGTSSSSNRRLMWEHFENNSIQGLLTDLFSEFFNLLLRIYFIHSDRVLVYFVSDEQCRETLQKIFKPGESD